MVGKLGLDLFFDLLIPVDVIGHFDGAGETSQTAGLDGIDDGAVLALHQGRDGPLFDFLFDQILVGRPAGVEDLSRRVDKRFDEGVRSPFVLSLDMVRGARVIDIRVVPSQNHVDSIPSK